MTNFIFGTGGDDVIHGTDGDDVIFAMGGDDVVHGGAGNDEIYGQGGDDVLYGGEGDDVLYGGTGNDRLYGGPGDDLLYGGPDDDAFVFLFGVEVGGGESGVLVAPDLNGARQADFGKCYREWLLENGIDVGDPESGWTWNQGDAEGPLRFNGEPVGTVTPVVVRTGPNEQIRWIATDIPFGEGGGAALTYSEGHDVIGDFFDGDNVIELVGLGGLDDATLEALFSYGFDEGGNAVLSWEGGSITILGYEEEYDSVLDFFARDYVLLLPAADQGDLV